MHYYSNSVVQELSPALHVMPATDDHPEPSTVLRLGSPESCVSISLTWGELDMLAAFLTGVLVEYRDGYIGSKDQVIRAQLFQTMHPRNAPR